MYDCNVPKVGEWLIGYYPRQNRTDKTYELMERELMCLSIRDLHKDPIHLVSVEKRPLLARGRYLMFAWDETIAETRNFYLNRLVASIEQRLTAPPLQIVAFDPDDPQGWMAGLGPEFGSDTYSRATLATACRKLRLDGSHELYRVRAVGA